MKKQVIINLNSGSFEQGFSQVNINIYWINENDEINSHKVYCHFNQAPELPANYDNWLKNYQELSNNYQELSKYYQRGSIKKDGKTKIPTQAELIAKITKRIANCNKAFEYLQESLNHWLSPVKEQLEQELDINAEEEIDVVIRTENISSQATKELVQKLPWHLWDFFSKENFTDVALSFSDSEEIDFDSSERMPLLPRPKRVKILCILGANTLGNSKDENGIDVEADRRFLRKIPGAYCVFLRQPLRSELIKFMEQERWDIFFFSGHSETPEEDINTGYLYLKPEETIDIREIKEKIQTAIQKYEGMKLAIFNSCNGLGLARQLSDLDIAQIIIWREPVPDKIAQEFLKSFLDSFSTTGLSLYRSVQKARLEIQEYISENDLPRVGWLPVIHHNLAKESITWEQLRGPQDRFISQYQTPRESLFDKIEFWIEGVLDKSLKKTPRESLLDKVEEFWIEGVLKESLDIEETIELGLSEYFDAVSNSSSIQGENSDHENRDLPEGTRAIDMFGELANKRTMLILGKAGSGKTIALLEIARESISDAKQDTSLPIPVVLNLSSWAAEKQQKPLADWLVQELNRIYQFTEKQCKAWVENQQLLLLLDGLDEVKKTKREACIIAINQFLRKYERTEMVVCCRIEDYNNVSEKLQFQSAVFYKQLTPEQIDRYFHDAEEELSAVDKLRENEKAIQELLNSPLIINIVTVAYKNKEEEELSHKKSKEERKYHLYDTYIRRRLEEEEEESSNSEPSKLKYSKEQSLHWLNWLAQKMNQKSQDILLIEQIQPDWLETVTQKWMYLIGFRLIFGLIVGLITVLHFGTQVTDNLADQLSLVIPSIIAALASSLSSLVLFSFMPRIIFKFIPRRISRRISRHISSFIPGVISGLIYVIIAASMVYPLISEQLITLLSPLMIDGIALGILLSLIYRKKINQKIGIIDDLKRDKKKAIRYSLFGLIGGSIYVLARWLLTDVYKPHPGLHGGLKVLHEFQYAPIIIELLMFTILPGLLGYLDKGDNSEQTIIPNQGVWRSAKNAYIFFTIFFLVGIIFGIPYSENTHEAISIALAIGLLAAMVAGKGPVFAGFVLIQHFTLRIILWLQGFTPWNYARFLDYATARIFLRKVGGGYIFIHRQLREHFAQIPLERDSH